MTKPAGWIFRHRYIVLSSMVLLTGSAMGGWLMMRRVPRSPMEPYIPANALGFIEVDSLGQLVDGLTSTQAWRELAPLLGVSSQLREVGQFTNVIGRLGLGPKEAVIAGRAQYALTVMGLDAETGRSDEGPYLHLKPRLVLVVKTHSDADAARSLVSDRAQIIAQRIYGDSATAHSDDYFGSRLRVFDGPGPGHQFIAASSSDVVLIGNDEMSVKRCLDAIEGRSPTLASDDTLSRYRSEVEANASVFGFVTAGGVERISGIAPALLAARFTSDPDQAAEISELFQHISSQAISGMLYGAELTSDGVTERYLTVLKPSLALELANLMKPEAGADFSQSKMVPPSAQAFTEVSVKGVGSLPERALRNLGPQFDIVGSLALKELVLSLRKKVGLEGSQSLEGALGDKVTFVRFSDAEPEAILIAVRDRSAVTSFVERYLQAGGGSIAREQYNNIEIGVSSNQDGRAAAFIGNILVLGTRAQISGIANYQMSGGSSQAGAGKIFGDVPGSAAIISSGLASDDAGKAMLAVSRITRVSDGSPELLGKDSVRKALQDLPRSVSFTLFDQAGVYTQTRSPVGNFGLLGAL